MEATCYEYSVKHSYVCEVCGNESLTWEGKCGYCQSWGTLKKIEVSSVKTKNVGELEFVDMDSDKAEAEVVNKTGLQELDIVLGRGFVAGSAVLISGEPGAGKSTLMMQIAINFARAKQKVVYVSGEESVRQVGVRYARLGGTGAGVQMVSTTSVDSLIASLGGRGVDLLIIDSIQTMDSGVGQGGMGSPSQVRGATYKLVNFAKQKGFSLLVSGHITKEGVIAGPKMLEHIVDVVLYIENSSDVNLRYLRCTKNRYGDVGNVGLLRMGASGYEDADMILSLGKDRAIGVSRSVVLEGIRPMVVTVQALVSKTQFSLPKRVVSGISINRAHLMIGILSKYMKMDFGNKDIYLNLSSGIKTSDVALDLAICVSLYSASKNLLVALDDIYVGEVGLDGGVVMPRNMDSRRTELKKHKQLRLFTEGAKRSDNNVDYRIVDILNNM